MLIDTVRAVLFDVDGTLLDTFDFIYGAFEHAFEVHGVPLLTREEISILMGGPLEEIYATMAAEFDAKALSETHRSLDISSRVKDRKSTRLNSSHSQISYA